MVNNENAIREAAYYLWQNNGCPAGRDQEFWAMAVEQLNSSSCKSSCKKTTTKKASASKTSTRKSCAKKSK